MWRTAQKISKKRMISNVVVIRIVWIILNYIYIYYKHIYILCFTYYIGTIWSQRKNLALVFLVFAKIVIVSLNKIGIKKKC